MNNRPSKIKQSKTGILTQLSTKKSETKRQDLKLYDATNEDGKIKEINVEDLPKSSFTYGATFPYLVNALSELCTVNPKYPNGEYVIQNQDNKNATHYSALLKWDTLVRMATDNEPSSKDLFRHEILKTYKNPPSLYVNLNNGYSMLTHPFIIRSIVYEDTTTMSKKDADTCAKLGITKKISHVDIEFLKPLFNACFEKNPASGFIYTDPSFYAHFIKTTSEMRTDTKVLPIMNRFYNPRTGKFILKTPTTYYKFILYFLMHVSSNSDHTTINAIDMLLHVDPGQLYEKNGKLYIKNKYETKLFIEKAGIIYNQMAKYGYCEYTYGVPYQAIYNNYDDNFVVYYKTETPRTNIETYTSNFIQGEIMHNEPKEIEYNNQEES